MRRTPVGILCALFAPVAFASQASSQPRDPYYVPYPSANAIAPPALHPPAPYYAPPNYYASATRPYGPPQYGYQSGPSSMAPSLTYDDTLAALPHGLHREAQAVLPSHFSEQQVSCPPLLQRCTCAHLQASVKIIGPTKPK